MTGTKKNGLEIDKGNDMKRLTEQIKNKETGEVLAYRLYTEVDRIRAYRKLGELEDLEEKGKLFGIWIPCSERLPDSGVDVNITTRSSIVGVGSFFEETNEWVQWYCGGGIVVDVIAWQPLPEPYKEE